MGHGHLKVGNIEQDLCGRSKVPLEGNFTNAPSVTLLDEQVALSDHTDYEKPLQKALSAPPHTCLWSSFKIRWICREKK